MPDIFKLVAEWSKKADVIVNVTSNVVRVSGTKPKDKAIILVNPFSQEKEFKT
jgi:hypothetical protein